MKKQFNIGSPLPHGDISLSNDGSTKIQDIHEIFLGKKCLLFAVPGAYTKNCTEAHFPSFVANEMEFQLEGFDLIACLAVNDTAVMQSWKSTFGQNSILMISDGDASYVKSLGLEIDEGIEAGIRSQRFVMIVEDLIVTHFWLDERGVVKTLATNVLAELRSQRLA